MPPRDDDLQTTSHASTPRKKLTAAAMATLIVAACASSPNGEAKPGTMDFALQKAARESAANHDHVAAATYWGAIYDKDPDNAEAAANYGRSLRYIGSLPKAISILHRAYLENSEHPLVLAEYGKILVSAGHSDEAVEMLERAIAIGEPDWSVWMAKGVALDNLGRHDEAQAAHKTALDLSPANPKVLNNLGLSLALSRRLDEAEIKLREAVATPGATPRMRQNLSLVLGLQGNFVEAERLASIDLNPRQVSQNIAYMKTLHATSSHWGVLSALSQAAPKQIKVPEIADIPERDAETSGQIAAPAAEPGTDGENLAAVPDASKPAGETIEPEATEAAVAPLAPIPLVEQNQLSELPDSAEPTDTLTDTPDEAISETAPEEPAAQSQQPAEPLPDETVSDTPVSEPSSAATVAEEIASGTDEDEDQLTDFRDSLDLKDSVAATEDEDGKPSEDDDLEDAAPETDDLTELRSLEDDVAEAGAAEDLSEVLKTEEAASKAPPVLRGKDWTLQKEAPNIPELTDALPGKPIPALQLLRKDSAIAEGASEAPTRIVPEEFYNDPS